MRMELEEEDWEEYGTRQQGRGEYIHQKTMQLRGGKLGWRRMNEQEDREEGKLKEAKREGRGGKYQKDVNRGSH